MKVKKNPPFSQQAYEIIKNKIIHLELAPGEFLMEKDLADEMGISRSPLREAIVRLENENFLVVEPRKGARVTELTPKKLGEVYEVRCALETVAATKAAPFIPDEEIEELEVNLKRIGEEMKDGNLSAFGESDMAFHDVFIKRCDNELLIDMVARLRDQLARIRSFADTFTEHTHKSYAEHQRLLKAMKARDPERLSQEVKTHLQNASSRLISALEKSVYEKRRQIQPKLS